LLLAGKKVLTKNQKKKILYKLLDKRNRRNRIHSKSQSLRK